ncbi:zinc knuckle CX2CX4HX4C containing protein [Tanacetum coccineum]
MECSENISDFVLILNNNIPIACPTTKSDTFTTDINEITGSTTTSQTSKTGNNSNTLVYSATPKVLNTELILYFNIDGVVHTSPNKSGSEKFSSSEGVDSVLRDGPWMIHEIPIFLNKWSPSVSILKEELSRVPVWMKFHDVLLVAYTSDDLSLISTKIGILIEINACNDFRDKLLMVVPNLMEHRYTKKTIHIEYEWVPPRCSTCLIYGHSLDDFPKAAPKRVVNGIAKGKGQTSGTDDEGFIEVKKKKSCGSNRGNKNFQLVSVKPKTRYQTKAKQSTKWMSNSPKTTPFVDTNKASTSGYNKE